MPLKRTTPRKPATPRVRRGNEQDQQALRRAALDAAMQLFQEQGLQGVTMRVVAAQVGVSAMALYRYFPNKAGLLHGLWEFTVSDLYSALAPVAADNTVSARQRLRQAIDLFLGYYESRPEYYRLLFMTDPSHVEANDLRWADAPIFREMLRLARGITRDVAEEIGGDPERVRLATDLRHALCSGYLHARLVNVRYPWQDMAALRKEAIEQIASSVENCLRHPTTAGDEGR